MYIQKFITLSLILAGLFFSLPGHSGNSNTCKKFFKSNTGKAHHNLSSFIVDSVQNYKAQINNSFIAKLPENFAALKKYFSKSIDHGRPDYVEFKKEVYEKAFSDKLDYYDRMFGWTKDIEKDAKKNFEGHLHLPPDSQKTYDFLKSAQKMTSKPQTQKKINISIKILLKKQFDRAFKLAEQIVTPQNISVNIYRYQSSAQIKKQGFLHNFASKGDSDIVVRSDYSTVKDLSQHLFNGTTYSFERSPHKLYPIHSYLEFKKLPKGITQTPIYPDANISFGNFHYQLKFEKIKDRALYTLGDVLTVVDGFERSLIPMQTAVKGNALRRFNDFVDVIESGKPLPTLADRFAKLDELHLLFEHVFHSLLKGDIINMPNNESIEVLIFGGVDKNDLYL